MKVNFYEITRYLDSALTETKPSATTVNNVIKYLSAPGIEPYFFSKVVGFQWFYILNKEGFFDPKNNPTPVENETRGYFSVPRWPVLDYLERISAECSKPENKHYAKDITDIIRNVTRPRNVKKVDNYRTWHIFAKMMINLPSDVISKEDIGLVGEWLDSNFNTSLVTGVIGKFLLPKFLESTEPGDWEKAAKLIDVVTRIRWLETKHGDVTEKEAHTTSEGYWLKELFKINARSLGEKCGEATTRALANRLEEVLKSEKEDEYSYIWRPAIEDHSQNIIDDDAKNILVSALRDVLLAHTRVKPENAREILRGLLTSKFIVLKRIALYVIGELYRENEILLSDFAHPDYFNMGLKHELFNLLKNNFKYFGSQNQNNIVDIITQLENKPRQGVDKNLMDKNLRLDWLQAVHGQGNEKADHLYEKYLKDVQYTSKHPEFPAYMESGSRDYVAPCSATDLLKKDIADIVVYISNFKASNNWEGPSEEGLADALKEAIKQEPAKFEDHLAEFLTVNLYYKRAIISAFKELWHDRREFNWQKVLEFCYDIVKEDKFWGSDETATEGNSKHAPGWLTSYISELIEDGTKKDKSAFDAAYLPIAKRIILRILDKEPLSSSIGEQDAYTDASNTPRGRTLLALLDYALRCARVADKKQGRHEETWEDIRGVFDAELDKCKDVNLEFSAIVGARLPNFYYLDKNWPKENIGKIFSEQYKKNWRAALIGYCYVNTIYIDIYKLLKEIDVFRKAMELDFEDSQFRNKLVQNVAIAYLQEVESLDDENSSLFKILRIWRLDDITEIIRFFWGLRYDKAKDKYRPLVLSFWRWCFNNTKGKENENAKILSDLNLLSVFLDSISDEQTDWLKQSSPYVSTTHNGSFFIKEIDRLADVNVQKVVEIYCEMITKSFPDREEENIRSIVEKFYKAGLKDQANQICNRYAENQIDVLLRDIYNKYNTVAHPDV